MRPNKPMMILSGFFLICMVAFSQTDSAPKPTIDEIANAALQSDKSYHESEGGWSGLDEYDIPPKYWSDAIKQLKPIKVYDFRLNVVIVLSIRDGVEEGIFVGNLLSSYAPFEGSDGNNGFEFKYIQGHAVQFRRNPVEDKYLRPLTGPNFIYCGYYTSGKEMQVFDCAMKAIAEKKPFRFYENRAGIYTLTVQGLVGTLGGKVLRYMVETVPGRKWSFPDIFTTTECSHPHLYRDGPLLRYECTNE
jgi:hypothetical protein